MLLKTYNQNYSVITTGAVLVKNVKRKLKRKR